MSNRDVGEVRVPYGALAIAAGLLFSLASILWMLNAWSNAWRIGECSSQRCVAGKPMLLQGTCFCVQPATATKVKP